MKEDTLAAFRNQVGERPEFTAEEEAALCRRMRAGDRQAADSLYRAIVYWCIKVAGGYAGSDNLTADGVLEIGHDAAIDAMMDFDPEEGRLSTWAGWKVQALISNMRRDRACQSLSEGNEPYNAKVRTPASVCGAAESHSATACQVRKAIERAGLTPREAEVLACREAGQTSEEIAEQVGISRRRVDQLHVSAAAKVRDCLGVETTANFRNLYRTYRRKPRRPHDGPRKPRKALPAQARLT